MLIMKFRSSEIKALRFKIAEKIVALRQKRGLTQEEMKKSGIGYRTYLRIEKEGPQSIKQLLQIAKALKIKPRELLDV